MRFKNYLKESYIITEMGRLNAILDDWGIREECSFRHVDGKILVDCNIGVNVSRDKLVDGKLPFQFGRVDGCFNASVCGLKSLEGFPSYVAAYVDLRDNYELTSLEHAPKHIGGPLYISNTTIRSLVGIHEQIERIDGSLEFYPAQIKEGGIGLIFVKGVKMVLFGLHREPFLIIQSYLGQPDKVYECQAELIDNGFEEFAKL